jgi:hypothetical protein
MLNSSPYYGKQDMEIKDKFFEFRVKCEDYEEYQKAMYINVPILVQFQVGHKHKFCIMTGIKSGIPIKSSYHSYAKDVKASLYD